MSKRDIINYLLNSPENSNKEVLDSMLDKLLIEAAYLKDLNLVKHDDYLYQAEYSDWDYEYAEKHMSKYIKPFLGCSSARLNNKYYRNYDWYYDESVEFIVLCDGKTGCHKSVGIASNSIMRSTLESNDYDDKYRILPFMTLDGFNDAGVYCNQNVVPFGDKGYTIGTNPGKTRICEIALPRLILDYADSAADAVELLNDYDVYAPLSSGQEIHLMIADSTATYVVEFIDNQIRVMSDQDDEYEDLPNNAAIMTNFYLSDWDGELITGFNQPEGIQPSETTLTPYASGIERYEILKTAYSEGEDALEEAIKEVWFTNAYKEETTPIRYSEFVGGLLNIYLPAPCFNGFLGAIRRAFKIRNRNNRKLWQTLHTSIYDLSENVCTLTIQEDETKTFTFDINGIITEESND